MQIRPFSPEDQSAVRTLVLQGLGEHFGFIDESLNPDVDDIASEYVARGDTFLVAEEDGNIVGCGSLRHETEGVGRLLRMSTVSTARRRGIGRRIFQALRQEAEGRGYHELRIATEPDWEDAVGFYQSLGFVPFDRDDVDVHMKLEL